MAWLFIKTVLFFALASGVSGVWRVVRQNRGRVVALEEVNALDKLVRSSSDGVLVLFHQPGCALCHVVTRRFENISIVFGKLATFRGIKLAKIDCDRNRKWCSHIDTVPKIYYYKLYERPVVYGGDYSEESVVEYARVSANIAGHRMPQESLAIVKEVVAIEEAALEVQKKAALAAKRKAVKDRVLSSLKY